MATAKPSSKASTSRSVKARSPRRSDQELDELWEVFEASPALCTVAELERLEHELTRGSLGLNRRVGLGMAVKTPRELVALTRKNRETALAVAEAGIAARDAAKRFRVLADLLEASAHRLAMALCERRDMRTIQAEAEAIYAD